MQCPKCQSECTVEVLPSRSDGKWRIKYECTKADCHLRNWIMVEEAEKGPVEAVKGMQFSKTRSLKCEICSQYTDILHAHTVDGDGDYLMCGGCIANFTEAEGLCRFNSNFL